MDFSIELDTMWVLLGAASIFFMQAGFAMLEAGFTRAKNAGNIIMKNLMDFACGSLVFLVIGYGLLYGIDQGGVIGKIDFFIHGSYDTGNLPLWAHVIFNTMFCGTAATIVSGAMAERTQFKSYLVYSIVISAIVYPISASWVWGGGWLSTLSIGGATGFIDYSGSALVHMVGGIAALIGAKMLGPRIGKYGKDGKPRGIPGQNITLGALGIFILWFAWFGFNPSSSYGLSTVAQARDVSNVFLTTNTSAAAAATVSMIFTWIRYGKPDVSMTLNGALAGLVAITAGCSAMDPWAAAITGSIAGILVVISIEWIEKKFKIDDPVGAIGVHGVCGMFGSIACGLFARDGGLFTTGETGQLAIQCIGVLAVGMWVGVTMTILFWLLKKTIGLRVPIEEEIAGLDSAEHGLQTAYADFFPAASFSSYLEQQEITTSSNTEIIPPEHAVPVMIDEQRRQEMDRAKLTKIVILTKQSKFEALKEALNQIGITGMTVTQVLGCGMQKGRMEYYRGVPIDTMQLLPKIQIDIVVAKIPPRKVIDTVKKVLYTGHIGDGKIFVYHVENAVKVRTGEEGYYAMQGVDE